MRWPGNVRELENFIEGAVILSRGPALRAPLAELRADPVETSGGTLADIERDDAEAGDLSPGSLIYADQRDSRRGYDSA